MTLYDRILVEGYRDPVVGLAAECIQPLTIRCLEVGVVLEATTPWHRRAHGMIR